MKVLLIGPYPVRNNGMSEYISHYRDELLRRGHEVATERMYFWREKRSAFRWLALRARLREGFDAVIVQHTPTASGPLLSLFLRAARRARVHVVVVGHEPPSIYAKHLPALLRFLYRAYERAVFSGAAARVVHTDLHAGELRALGVTAPIIVIPIPVYGSPPEPPPSKGRAGWGTYGMISPKKGLDLLLEAYQSRPAGYFPPLRILGGPAPGHSGYVESLKAKIIIGYKDHIVFYGYVENEALAGEFSRLSLMIFPYRWVSQSAALAQTCFHRIPYLASDLPYFVEFQRRYGCGDVFRTGSAEALAEVLVSARQNPPRAEDLPFDALIQSLSLSHCVDQLLHAIAHATIPQ